MSVDMIPTELRNLRACLLCGLIKTFDQFELHGCDNCEQYLQMQDNRDVVYECTSANFDGFIAMMSPSDSWVARWQRIDQLAKGIYASSVNGELPTPIILELRRKGIVYRSRNTAK